MVDQSAVPNAHYNSPCIDSGKGSDSVDHDSIRTICLVHVPHDPAHGLTDDNNMV